MIKNISLFLVTLLVTTGTFAQKKEKIKGSKIVTIAIKEINSFENIEVTDNFEVLLVQGEKTSVEIEADDNLHDIINYEIAGNTLRITALKTPISYKKFAVRINYSEVLKLITVRDEVEVKALAPIELDNITVKNYDVSKSFLNIKSNYFALILDQKARAEINVTAESTSFELSKNSEVKALVSVTDFKLDMYQKSEATIEGTATNGKIRLDNTSALLAGKFTVNDLEIATENYAKCEVNCISSIKIIATGKSLIELFGTPKITIEKFTDTATLSKKEKK